jgi:hypothetical protein
MQLTQNEKNKKKLEAVKNLFLLLFLGAFALRKATLGFAMSVRLGQLGSQWTYFHEIWYWSVFQKFVRKIHCKSDKYKWYFI